MDYAYNRDAIAKIHGALHDVFNQVVDTMEKEEFNPSSHEWKTLHQVMQLVGMASSVTMDMLYPAQPQAELPHVN